MKPNIHWKKDKGREPLRDEAHFPWFWEAGRFNGLRANDVHLDLAVKHRARTDGNALVGPMSHYATRGAA